MRPLSCALSHVPSLMCPLSCEGRIAQEGAAQAIEEIRVLDHHPVPALREEKDARLLHRFGDARRAAHRAEAIVHPPEREDRTFELRELRREMRDAQAREDLLRLELG